MLIAFRLFWHKSDMLQLILDKAISKGESTAVITQRILFLNFASIHTTSSVSGRCRYLHAMHYVSYI